MRLRLVANQVGTSASAPNDGGAGPSNRKAPSPEPPVAIDLGPGGRLSPQDKKRINKEAGESIHQVKRDVRYRAATTDLERMASSLKSLIKPKATECDRVGDFIERVVNDPLAKVKHDPVDANYQTHSAKINGSKVTLSLTEDDTGNLHVHAFVTALKKNPAIERTFQELKADGWTLRYGSPTHLNPIVKTVTIDPTAPKAALGALWNSLQNVEFADGKQPVAVTVERAVEHFRHNDPTVGARYPRGTFRAIRRLLQQSHGAGDGYYNAMARAIQVPKSGYGQFIPSEHPADVTLHDAVMVGIYRTMFAALNLELRNGDGQPSAPARNMRNEIDKSLASFRDYTGDVIRFTGGPRSHEGPVPDERIQAYEKRKGQVVVEPAFMSCAIQDASPSRYEGNVHYVIGSEHGKILGSLSPHNEVLFRSGTPFFVEDVVRQTTKPKEPPMAQIHMSEGVVFHS